MGSLESKDPGTHRSVVKYDFRIQCKEFHERPPVLDRRRLDTVRIDLYRLRNTVPSAVAGGGGGGGGWGCGGWRRN